MSDREPYNLDAPAGGERKKRRRTPLAARVGKVWLVETFPRLLLGLVVLWLVLLFHTLFTERAEFAAVVAQRRGRDSYMMVPGSAAPSAAHRWTLPVLDRAVMTGDSLRTGNDGSITVRFFEGSSVRVNPNSSARIHACSLHRSSGARVRIITLTAGSLYVDAATPTSDASQFIIRMGNGNVSGFNAFYFVSGNRVTVVEGEVFVKAGARGYPVTLGKTFDFATRKVRNTTPAEQKTAAAAGRQMPEIEFPDKVKFALVNLEERFVLKNSVWLLDLLHLEPGAGNPFAGLSVFNSSRRAQAEQRLADLHQAMTGITPPRSLRLDDFGTLGVSTDKLPLMRQAFYRGQLMTYQAHGEEYRITARANDRQHTLITLTQSGVVKIER